MFDARTAEDRNEAELLHQLALYRDKPLEFVQWAFPWERGELEKYKGPEPWQADQLGELGKALQRGDELVQFATTSGHGVGKSADVSWLCLWGISTFEDTLGVVTANTETQLRTKTWVQLAKWHRLFIGRHHLDLRATGLFVPDPVHERTWRIDSVPWSERNTEAFAGLHNQGKRILLIMDEASAIPDVIWETAEGALTDKNTQKIWCVFGNPTRNKGRFRECFDGGRFAHRWTNFKVDSRQVSFTDHAQIGRWIEDYGDDSDFVRVRVKGQFPRTDAVSFIPFDLALEAVRRTPLLENRVRPVIGLDVGRFGDDPSVIYPRKGLDAATLMPEVLYQTDTMTTAGRAAAMLHRIGASMIVCDEGGVGGGVVDRLRQLNVPVQAVDFGSKPLNWDVNDQSKYANRRAEIWGTLRGALANGLCIPERIQGYEVGLIDELTGPTYGLSESGAIQLEKKQDMRRRGVASPNVADALALTYAFPLLDARDAGVEMPVPTSEYNPYENARIWA